ncbi:MAG TPA: TraR/DksA C4-type zinc finger protein [Cytophagaceae bacterium]|jgi:hypothetical protein|nr:TraR/DksA C4-type zinc finger protein [Cytophagaceae bacterium]
MRACISCGKEIPEQRLKILPNSKTCVQCSETVRVAGFPLITNKTSYSELQIVNQETAQELYAKQDRKGGVSTGVQFKNSTPPKMSNFE